MSAADNSGHSAERRFERSWDSFAGSSASAAGFEPWKESPDCSTGAADNSGHSAERRFERSWDSFAGNSASASERKHYREKSQYSNFRYRISASRSRYSCKRFRPSRHTSLRLRSCPPQHCRGPWKPRLPFRLAIPARMLRFLALSCSVACRRIYFHSKRRTGPTAPWGLILAG